MKRLIATVAFIALLIVGGAFAAERTVTLKIDNLSCPTCPYIIEKSLSKVRGVEKVEVSFKEKTATVTYDDTQTDMEALTRATGSLGFPSQVVERGNHE
jgi:mercuric ion binding protein